MEWTHRAFEWALRCLLVELGKNGNQWCEVDELIEFAINHALSKGRAALQVNSRMGSHCDYLWMQR